MWRLALRPRSFAPPAMGLLWLCVALAAAAAAAVFTVFLLLWLRRPRTDIPGPAALPLIGNLLYFRHLPVVSDHFRALHRRYGSVYRFYIGPVLMIHVTHPEDAKRVLAGSRVRDRGPYIARPLRSFLGNGLITSSGEQWKTHRRIIEQSFHPEVLKQFMDAFNEGAEYACERLEEALGSEVELYEPFCVVTLRTIAASAMGLSFDEVEPDRSKQDEIGSAFLTLLSIIQKRIFQPWTHFEWMVSFTSDSKVIQQHINTLFAMVKRGIAIKKPTIDIKDEQKKRSLVDTLLGTDVPMTEQEIFDEICTILAAGTDTTAGTLGFALCLLALYPEWQSAAHQELDDVFGTGGDYLRRCTLDDLARLQVIDSIVKETLRLYPTVPIPVAHLPEDTPLDGGRFLAPRGSYVFVALFLLHRHPQFFPDPETFNPARFLDGDSCLKHPCSYLPFGAGPRRCVGARYAVLEIKTVMAAVLRRFRVLAVSTREELDHFTISTSCQPAKGCRVKFVRRVTLPSRKAT